MRRLKTTSVIPVELKLILILFLWDNAMSANGFQRFIQNVQKFSHGGLQTENNLFCPYHQCVVGKYPRMPTIRPATVVIKAV
jgi:hypothetical protein